MNSNGTKESINKTDFKRARGEEQKQQRINQFLDAAAELYDEIGYEKVSLTKIGEGLGFHRNNVYNYFNCKQDLFLTLLMRETDEFIADGIAHAPAHVEDLDTLARTVTEVHLRHQRFLELLSMANSTLLIGASANVVCHYRENLYSGYNRFKDYLHKNVHQQLTDEQVGLIIDYFTTYAMGLYPASIQHKQKHNVPIISSNFNRVSDFEEHFQVFVATIFKTFYANK